MTIFHDALNTLKPSAFWVITGDDTYANIDWRDEEQTKPTELEVDAKVAELQADYDALDYSRNRKAEYPTIQECVHAILDDDLDALQVLRQAVKDKYPKP